MIVVAKPYLLVSFVKLHSLVGDFLIALLVNDFFFSQLYVLS